MINPAPNAIRFIEMMQVKAGRNAMLGSKDSFTNDTIRRTLGQVNEDVSASIEVINRLSKDESRTPPSLHHRGKQEAETLTGKLYKARDTLRAEANKIEGEALANINDAFTLDPSRAIFQSRKLDWLAKQWADPNGGTVAINKQIRLDPELASLINSGEGYILGIPEDARYSFVATAVKAHLPDAQSAIETAGKTRELADKYDGVAASVHSSFYIESVAERFNTRVE